MAFSREEILVSYLEEVSGTILESHLPDHLGGYHVIGEGTRKVRDRRDYFRWYNKHMRKK